MILNTNTETKGNFLCKGRTGWMGSGGPFTNYMMEFKLVVLEMVKLYFRSFVLLNLHFDPHWKAFLSIYSSHTLMHDRLKTLVVFAIPYHYLCTVVSTHVNVGLPQNFLMKTGLFCLKI